MSANRLLAPSGRPGPARAGGFTLVELLASIGIIIFVLSLSILAVGPALRSASTKDAARRARAGIEGARVRAIQQRRAVRFQAQCVLDSSNKAASPEHWETTPNAGDPTYEWNKLPELVTLRASAGGAGWGTALTGFSVTFGADASVKAAAFRTEGSTTWSTLDYAALQSVLRLRLHTVREAPEQEVNLSTAFIEITPITGVITSYGYDEYKTGGKVKDGDLPYTPKN